MAKAMKGVFIIALIVVGAFMLKNNSNKYCGGGVCGLSAAAPAAASDLRAADFPEGSEQISFVELGSVNCIPCKKMQPIVDELRKEYAGKVKVVFHDVWTEEGKAYAEEYRIRLIPVQVFLNKTGKEITRHEGFFPKADIEKIFKDNGVTK